MFRWQGFGMSSLWFSNSCCIRRQATSIIESKHSLVPFCGRQGAKYNEKIIVASGLV